MSGVVHPPRLERFGPKTLTGLLRPHDPAQDDAALFRELSEQWQDCAARRLAFSGKAAKTVYGVFRRMADGDREFHYFCGAESDAQGREGFVTLQLPKLYCAVFQRTGHALEMPGYIRMIFGTVLPMAGLEPARDAPGVPEFIERYDEHFDHKTGEGTHEILFPIKE